MTTMHTRDLTLIRALLNGAVSLATLAKRQKTTPDTLLASAYHAIKSGMVRECESDGEPCLCLTTKAADWVNENASIWLRKAS